LNAAKLAWSLSSTAIVRSSPEALELVWRVPAIHHIGQKSHFNLLSSPRMGSQCVCDGPRGRSSGGWSDHAPAPKRM